MQKTVINGCLFIMPTADHVDNYNFTVIDLCLNTHLLNQLGSGFTLAGQINVSELMIVLSLNFS